MLISVSENKVISKLSFKLYLNSFLFLLPYIINPLFTKYSSMTPLPPLPTNIFPFYVFPKNKEFGFVCYCKPKGIYGNTGSAVNTDSLTVRQLDSFS